MEELKTIYRILKILQQSMDYEEFDKSSLSAKSLGLSEPKWSRIMTMLSKEGYLSGIEVWNSMYQSYPRVELIRPEITLQGLEYLENNSLMKKISNTAKGIVDVTTNII